jgi:hypothetical protein
VSPWLQRQIYLATRSTVDAYVRPYTSLPTDLELAQVGMVALIPNVATSPFLLLT